MRVTVIFKVIFFEFGVAVKVVLPSQRSNMLSNNSRLFL